MNSSSQPKLGHPPALPVLFFTEMWERFSYYGMRALLVLYAVKYLHFSDQEAGKLYGAYTGFVYLTPIIGGYLADRYIGFRRSIVMGCILMGLGHLSLAIDGMEFFYLGLILLVIGNGFFKPNMSSLVGRLYENNQSMKDSGYTIFYMGINLGGFFGPIICGYLGETMGWHYGFGAAGIGMSIGLLVFLFGQYKIPSHIGNVPNRVRRNTLNDKTIETQDTIILSPDEKNKISILLVLSFFSVFFWTAFEQAGSSMNLFADRYVDRVVLGWEIPASIFQSINPVFILIFAPLFAWIWTFTSRRNKEPDSAVKFSIGLFLLSLGFVCLVLGAKEVTDSGISSLHWLVLAYLFNTWGELCLSPVGLSMVSKLSPDRFTGLMMGIWLMSNAISHMLGGFLSGYMDDWGSMSFFSLFVIMSFIASILLYSIRSKLRVGKSIES